MRPYEGQQNQSGQAAKDELRRLQQRNQYARRSQQWKEQDTEESFDSRKRKFKGREINVQSESNNFDQASVIPQSFEAGPSATQIPGTLELSEPHKLRVVKPCKHCRAMRIQYEPAGFCCTQGKIILASPAVSDALYSLYTSNDLVAEDFRARCRVYNSIFLFTSFRATLDNDLANSRQRVYTFRAQGQVYHSLPTLKPSENGPCYFQLYFYDTDNETQNRMRIMNDMPLNRFIVESLVGVMDNNPYAIFFRALMDRDLDKHVITIRTDVNLDQRVYNAPTSDQVAGVWVEGNNPSVPHERDIIVYATSGLSHKVNHYYGCYDPLQYPLLFPCGEVGWHQNILKKNTERAVPADPCVGSESIAATFSSVEDIFSNEQEGVNGGNLSKVSCREYYSYKLQVRVGDRSILLYARRLLQQFIVDMYIKVESTRLDFFRKQQSRIRAELYQGIVDSVVSGETRGNKVGKRVVLPTSFVGGPRDMRRRYLNAISLVSRFGKPDLFITMTCNPEWQEIKELLKDGQTAQDRPDLSARVFRAKLHDLKKQLFTEKNIWRSCSPCSRY